MPIFQDDMGTARDSLPPPKPPSSPDPGPMDYVDPEASPENDVDESGHIMIHEGLILRLSAHEAGREGEGLLDTNYVFPPNTTSDRTELIERLKRGESPTWLPSNNLGSFFQDQNQHISKSIPKAPNSSPLLPAAEVVSKIKSPVKRPPKDTEQTQEGLNIERPRSALHSGDFTEGPRPGHQCLDHNTFELNHNGQIRGKHCWLPDSSPQYFAPFNFDIQLPSSNQSSGGSGTRFRAPSLPSSCSSSFILKPPTSPLVHSQNNDDLDIPRFLDRILLDSSPDSSKSHRRHSLQSSQSYQSSTLNTNPDSSRPLPNLRRDITNPYQAHQPRRSLTFGILQQAKSSPQTPASLRCRRPSFTLDSPPLLHASMVGSYEESILKGRMSTTPSKPLDFVAQIGVLGLGKCRSSLRCPAHVTIPFPAVFYSYETTSHGRPRVSEDGPSPYVGQIDLESGLPNPDEREDKRRRRRPREKCYLETSSGHDIHKADHPSERDLRRAEKQKRRSVSPRIPLGGSYRIPEKGQLQIIIKNPNKTAVKLFLVPYELAGMEPGTKTFIRQRSYSAGPIIDSASPSSSLKSQAPSNLATLRYLIHLHICCPARGRYYLYKSIRLVFANRVPDGKEKLRNEISLPEPRFTVYKPSRDMGGSSAGASLAAEKAFRRRSAGFCLGGLSHCGPAVPIEPIPFALFHRPPLSEDDTFRDGPLNQLFSPESGSSHPPTSRGSVEKSLSWTSDEHASKGYDKLIRGDVVYGGNAFLIEAVDEKQPGHESLLSKRLKELGVGMPRIHDKMDGI